MLRQMILYVKRAFVCSILLLGCAVSFAQELKVVSFEDTTADEKKTPDLYALKNKRLDLNDVPCAVLKISIPYAEEFSCEASHKVGEEIYAPGEVIVYMAEGARSITIKSEKYGVLKYDFPNRMKLKRQVTYRMFVKIPSLGIGGRKIAYGVNAGYLLPMISTSSNGGFTGSAVNYALANSKENASYSSSGGFSVGMHVDFRIYRSFHLLTGVNFLHYKYENQFDEDVNIVRRFNGATSYEQRGITQNRYKENYSMNVLEIPVLASYRLPVTAKSHVQFNAGPVISYGLSSKLDLSGNTDSETMKVYNISDGNVNQPESESYGSSLHYMLNGEFDLYSKEASYVLDYGTNTESRRLNFAETPFKRLNFGALVGVVYEYEGISVGLEYNLMLSNMANKNYWEGDRLTVFENMVDNVMRNYKQRNCYLKFSVGYTFRY